MKTELNKVVTWAKAQGLKVTQHNWPAILALYLNRDKYKVEIRKLR